MVCPKCGSNNVNIQMVQQTKRRGCFTIFLYVLLACTIIGIPIMILIAILRGKKTVNKKVNICQNCGHSW